MADPAEASLHHALPAGFTHPSVLQQLSMEVVVQEGMALDLLDGSAWEIVGTTQVRVAKGPLQIHSLTASVLHAAEAYISILLIFVFAGLLPHSTSWA